VPNPSKIMIIRHAEKPVSPPPFGVNEDGTQSQHALTTLGWQRAGALIAFFAAPTVAAIAVPRTLYASAVVSEGPPQPSSVDDFGKSRRPIETISPLSRLLGITPDQTFAVGDEDRLARRVALTDGVVLIAWEHQHIPLIAKHFSRASPDVWPGDRFDVVWVLDRATDGSYGFIQVPQLLLAEDVQ
jgi:hypothetical protein